MQPSATLPAPVLDVEPAEPAPKKKRLSRLEERREARARAAAGGGGDSGSAESQTAVTGRCVLIGREVLVYLAEQGQLDVDAFNLLGFWNRRAPTAYTRRRACHASGGNAVSGVYRSGYTMGSRPPPVRPSDFFQRSPTSLGTCAVG